MKFTLIEDSMLSQSAALPRFLPMDAYKRRTEKEIQRVNQLQRTFFSELTDVFDPPLPEGVPERLKMIVASGKIAEGDVVLDVGTGTGILVPLIQEYQPATIFACDLSETMLIRLKDHYPYAHAIAGDVRELTFPDNSVDVVFMNACYPNIADKDRSFENIGRMMKPGARIVISHPLGKDFIGCLKAKSPFPLDDFPERHEAEDFLERYGLRIVQFTDDFNLYILLAVKKDRQ